MIALSSIVDVFDFFRKYEYLFENTNIFSNKSKKILEEIQNTSGRNQCFPGTIQGITVWHISPQSPHPSQSHQGIVGEISSDLYRYHVGTF